MATKGEKIVTILCGTVVTPAAENIWPKELRGVIEYHEHVLPSERSERARVVGVFMRDGEVWLLIQGLLDDKLAETKAVGWKVESRI